MSHRAGPRVERCAPPRWRRLSLLALLLYSGCVWRSYADVMRVHLDVLSSFADKVTGNAELGRRPTSNDVTELLYPLQRARQFVHQYRGSADWESYRLFVAALDRYQALVGAIDAARGDDARWTEQRARLPAQHQALAEAVVRTREALARESARSGSG